MHSARSVVQPLAALGPAWQVWEGEEQRSNVQWQKAEGPFHLGRSSEMAVGQRDRAGVSKGLEAAGSEA